MWKCVNCAAVLDDEYFECYICGKPLDQGDLIIDKMYEQSTTPRNKRLGISLLFGFNLLIGGLGIPVTVASIFAVFGFMGEPTLMEQSLGSIGFVSYIGMWWFINSLIIRRWLVKRELYWLLVFIFLAFGILTVWLFWG